MKIFRFTKEVGQSIERYQSSAVTYTQITKLMTSSSIGYMFIEPKGIVGLHEAPAPQLLLVVQGEGWVRGQDENRISVKMGEGVFWERGEWHESGSENGMTCIIIQCDDIDIKQLHVCLFP